MARLSQEHRWKACTCRRWRNLYTLRKVFPWTPAQRSLRQLQRPLLSLKRPALSLLEMLNTVQFNAKRQTFVFSAILTMAQSLPTRVLQKKGKKVDQRSKLEVLMEKMGIRSKPKVIDLTRKEATVETLTETRIH
nr:ATP-dependent RNA helicase DDX24-like [Salvelinus alpinus]